MQSDNQNIFKNNFGAWFSKHKIYDPLCLDVVRKDVQRSFVKSSFNQSSLACKVSYHRTTFELSRFCQRIFLLRRFKNEQKIQMLTMVVILSVIIHNVTTKLVYLIHQRIYKCIFVLRIYTYLKLTLIL